MPRAHCLFAVLAVAAGVSVHADVIDTFDNGVNLGTWRLTSNPSRLYQIEPAGGNPGAYLHGQVAAAVPTWYIDQPVGNLFTGDFAAEGVSAFSYDMNISGGVQVPDRNLTLHLYTTLGTGDPVQGIEAYFIGDDISEYTPEWDHHEYPLDATSATIPSGWTVFEGDGTPGTDADWQTLVRHVENVTIALGTPGFFYPNLNIWDLGLDNVRLTTVPAPGAMGVVLLGIPLLRRRSRR
jgi:hypothetical protein